MSKAKAAYAIWPWGTDTREQYVQAVSEISQVGYRYFESVNASIDVFIDRIEDFKELNCMYGVTPVSFYFHLSGDFKQDTSNLARKAPFMKECGIDCISLQGAGSPDCCTSPELLRYTLDTIKEMGRICGDFGIMPCVHPHYATSIMYEKEIDYIMENTKPDEVFFGPDTAHLVAGGCDPVAIFQKYASRIRFTHMKDILGTEMTSQGFQAGVEVYTNFRELGEGCVDFPSVFKVLDTVGYDRYFCVELDRTRTTHKNSAAISLEYLKKTYLDK